MIDPQWPGELSEILPGLGDGVSVVHARIGIFVPEFIAVEIELLMR